MSINVNIQKLTDSDYAKTVYQSYLQQDGEYKVDKTILQTIEDNFGSSQVKKWKAEINSTSKDVNEIEIEDTALPGETGDDEKVENKQNIIRKDDINGKRGKVEKWLSLGAGLGALGCGGYVAATMGMGAGAVTIGSIGVALAAIVAFTVGMAYLANKPNKDTHEELQILEKAMLENDVELANAQIKIQEAQGKVEVIRNEIEETENESNEELEAKEKELAEKQARIDELNEKAESEEGLTEEEKTELETLAGEVQTLSDEIAALRETNTEKIDDKKENLNEEQENLNEAAGVFNSVKDIADYAATFDEAARDSANEEEKAQEINAALGLGAAAGMSIPILGLTPLGQIARFMALTGGTISLFGAKEQKDFSQDMTEEIGVRKGIQSQVQEEVPEIESTEEAAEEALTKAESTKADLDASVEKAEEAADEAILAAASTPEEALLPSEPDAAEPGKDEPEDDEKPEKLQ